VNRPSEENTMAYLLQVAPLSARLDRELASRYDILPLWQDETAARLDEVAEAIEVVVTGSRFGCSAELMTWLPALKAIVSFGVGYDPIDVPAAQARGIAISNTPEVLNDCVADLAMGLIIDGRRQLSRADRFVRAGGWLNGNLPLARRVTGSRLGILGLGRIGLAVARRAEGFAMPVRYHNRRPLTDCPYEYAGSLVELARWADVLLLTCVGGPQTRGLVDRDVLEALGPEGLLVNVARGSVVDEPALVDALQAGRLGGAALDVFAQEPQVPEALLGMDNVVLLPHIGSATRETRGAMEDLVLANLQRFLAEGQLVTPV